MDPIYRDRYIQKKYYLKDFPFLKSINHHSEYDQEQEEEESELK